MGLRVVCLADWKVPRAQLLADAFALGVARHQDSAFTCEHFTQHVVYDVIVAYGWRHWRHAFDLQLNAGRAYVFIDGAYFGRVKDHRDPNGFHKVTINGRHPKVAMDLPGDRFDRFDLRIKPWRETGEHILLAGMSAKNATDLGIPPGSWERTMIDRLQSVSKRPIVYRPKPTWRDAPALRGTRYSPPTEPLEDVLRGAWAVVTHHSNVSVDGLRWGIPCYIEEGAALPFSMQTLDRLEEPPQLEGRDAFMNGVAWWQWSLSEMRSGACWEFIKGQIIRGEAIPAT